ncbi:hypothetical protein D3C77_747910 [compost metagenome]
MGEIEAEQPSLKLLYVLAGNVHWPVQEVTPDDEGKALHMTGHLVLPGGSPRFA